MQADSKEYLRDSVYIDTESKNAKNKIAKLDRKVVNAL